MKNISHYFSAVAIIIYYYGYVGGQGTDCITSLIHGTFLILLLCFPAYPIFLFVFLCGFLFRVFDPKGSDEYLKNVTYL